MPSSMRRTGRSEGDLHRHDEATRPVSWTEDLRAVEWRRADRPPHPTSALPARES